MLNANSFIPTDAGSIPTGEIRNVQGTPFSFLKPTAIGERIDGDDQQLKLAVATTTHGSLMVAQEFCDRQRPHTSQQLDA
jgi:hypothetical protein